MGASPWSRTLYYGFCAATLTTIALLPRHGRDVPGVLVGLVLIAGVVPARTFWLRDRRGGWTVLSFVLYFLAFAVLQRSTGGAASLLTPIIVLPVAGGALHGGLGKLAAVVGGVFLTVVVPGLLFGSDVPVAHALLSAVAWTLVSACIGLVVHGLVRELAGRDREQRALLRVVENYGILTADLDGQVVAINDGARTLLAMDPATPLPPGLSLRDLGAAPDRDRWSELLATAARDGRAVGELDWVNPVGTAFVLEVTVSPRTGARGTHTGWTIFVLDVTAAARVRSAAARSELRWRTLMENLPETVVLVVGEDLRYRVASGGGLAPMGLTEAAGKTPGEVFGADLGRELEASHRQALAGSTSRVEFSFDGAAGPLSVAMVAAPLPADPAAGTRPGGDREALVLGIDVSEQRRHEAVLSYLADHDPLTGLANRRSFDAELRAHLGRRPATGPRGAVLVLDLDQFKAINDTLGHSAGDQVIVATADILQARLRAEDVVARLGGDEFAILLRRVDAEEAAKIADDIVRAVRQHEYVLEPSPPRRTSVSIGVVAIAAATVDATELMATADLTMYDAKESGRDRYAICDPDSAVRPRMAARLAWAERLVEALEHDRFLFYAQPILDIAAGTVTGAEILLRMRDEDGAIVSPGRFLGVAERVGLIVEIDTLAVEKAVETLAQIQPLLPWFRIAVNVSGLSVGDPDLVTRIVDALARRGVAGSGLVLEITETDAAPDFEAARRFQATLREYGVRFALDDFGAGMGSLAYVKRLRFDYLKIDGDFVETCRSNAVDRLIIDAVVAVARGLGVQTIAEHVVDAEALDVVTRAGVDHAQGFEVGAPLPIPALLAALGRGDVGEAAPQIDAIRATMAG